MMMMMLMMMNDDDDDPAIPRTWLVNKWRLLRTIEAEVGSGVEARLSSLKMGHFLPV